MKYFFLIDPVERLVLKKDSTLLWALTLKQKKKEVYLIFENDFYVTNDSLPTWKAYSFSGKIQEKDFYIKDFILEKANLLQLSEGDTVYMRLDPPFDSRYLRYLWMLEVLETQGINVSNSPKGIITNNEKLAALKNAKQRLPSYIGGDVYAMNNFIKSFEEKFAEIILKPLDFYQGIGIQKIKNDENALSIFSAMVKEYRGPIIVQPFIPEVSMGEIRAIFYKNREIGSIIKVPPKGKFLANIAQGATFEAVALKDQVKKDCENMCIDLTAQGVDLVSFDILNDVISEANVTCPGLLVETSFAHKKNLALSIMESL